MLAAILSALVWSMLGVPLMGYAVSNTARTETSCCSISVQRCAAILHTTTTTTPTLSSVTHLLFDCEQLGRVGFPLFVVRSLLFFQATGKSSGAVFQVLLQPSRRFVLGLIMFSERAGVVAAVREAGTGLQSSGQVPPQNQSSKSSRGVSRTAPRQWGEL